MTVNQPARTVVTGVKPEDCRRVGSKASMGAESTTRSVIIQSFIKRKILRIYFSLVVLCVCVCVYAGIACDCRCHQDQKGPPESHSCNSKKF